MDYDRTDIPAAYDRGRDHGPEVLALWMDAIEAHLAGKRVNGILDLGCGTGRFSAGLAARFDTEVIGIDPSAKMLEQARAKQRDTGVRYDTGSAESIPLPTESIDLIFMSMSLHHFEDPALAARESRRVLRPGGDVVVRTGSRGQIEAYPYVPFFPSSRSILEDLLPSTSQICAWFEEAGFQTLVSEVIFQTIAPDWATYADKLSAGGDSVIAQLGQEELDSGLRAIRNHVPLASGGGVVEPIDLCVFQ